MQQEEIKKVKDQRKKLDDMLENCKIEIMRIKSKANYKQRQTKIKKTHSEN